MQDVPTPTPREQEILKILWEQGPCSVRAVYRLLQAREPDLSPLFNDSHRTLTIERFFAVTTAADDGPGSLRQAILDANAHAGADTIVFAISGAGVHTIQPLSALPAVTGPVVLDGWTQTGFAGTPGTSSSRRRPPTTGRTRSPWASSPTPRW